MLQGNTSCFSLTCSFSINEPDSMVWCWYRKIRQLLYRVCVGKASQELDLPMRPGSVFRIASISKQFTALLVALSIEEVGFILDSLAIFFPSIKQPLWRKISLRSYCRTDRAFHTMKPSRITGSFSLCLLITSSIDLFVPSEP